MKRIALFAATAFVFGAVACAQRSRGVDTSAPPLAKSENEKKILKLLDEMRRGHRTKWAVPPADGRMLRLLTESLGAKHVLEIGTSTGYSGLWFCLALQTTGGRLTTLEYDAGRAGEARGNFQQGGVDDMVTLIEGDAHQTLARVKGPVDIVFIDAEKSGYIDYLEQVLPLVRPGGLILAHNLDMVPEYIKKVTADPNLETVFYMQGGGLGITMKKR